MNLTDSEVNHLRRLLGWVRCEIGQSPEELLGTVKSVADALGHPELSAEAKERFILSYYNAERVPKYVRAAIKALENRQSDRAMVIDPEVSQVQRALAAINGDIPMLGDGEAQR